MKQYPNRVLPIDEVVPYWRNPRRVPDEAVNALAQSIKEFGYQQPIVVDEENTIIIGHTRYAALRRIGVTEVEVKVAEGLSPAQVKELRVIDNRTAEFTDWDYSALMAEIGDLDSTLLSAFFPNMEGGEVAEIDLSPERSEGLPWDEVDTKVPFVCPSCFHGFTMEVTREAIFSGVLGKKEAGR